MTVANHVTLAIHPISLNSNDLSGNWNTCIRQADSVKLQLEKTLTNKVTRFLFCLEVAGQVASSRQDRVSELVKALQLADEWVANCDSRGRKIWLVECAVQKCPGGY